jgi:hypothetical protein
VRLLPRQTSPLTQPPTTGTCQSPAVRDTARPARRGEGCGLSARGLLLTKILQSVTHRALSVTPLSLTPLPAPQARAKVLQFVTQRALPDAAKDAAYLLEACCFAYPAASLRHLVPPLAAVTARDDSARTLAWRLRLLVGHTNNPRRFTRPEAQIPHPDQGDQQKPRSIRSPSTPPKNIHGWGVWDSILSTSSR